MRERRNIMRNGRKRRKKEYMGKKEMLKKKETEKGRKQF